MKERVDRLKQLYYAMRKFDDHFKVRRGWTPEEITPKQAIEFGSAKMPEHDFQGFLNVLYQKGLFGYGPAPKDLADKVKHLETIGVLSEGAVDKWWADRREDVMGLAGAKPRPSAPPLIPPEPEWSGLHGAFTLEGRLGDYKSLVDDLRRTVTDIYQLVSGRWPKSLSPR